jgi:cytochrome o ubiquinol oxidase subunit II
MNKKIKIVILALLILGVVTMAVLYLSTADASVLNPKGEIAEKERNLLVFSVMLVSVIIIPVFTLLGFISWRYREGNKRATYKPNWDGNKILETIWWGIPCLIILVLAVVTWRTSHELDPHKALVSNTKPINIQVVALQWKWLFIYPDQQIASVNEVEFPENTPINFSITADAPMNAFWIPNLGSQVYAMSGMSSKLHLSSNEIGDYKGSSSNISGKGFADMTFTARVRSDIAFNDWVSGIKKSSGGLDRTSYEELAKPGTNKEPMYYTLKDSALYDSIMMKYMAPSGSHSGEIAPMDMPGMEGM